MNKLIVIKTNPLVNAKVRLSPLYLSDRASEIVLSKSLTGLFVIDWTALEFTFTVIQRDLSCTIFPLTITMVLDFEALTNILSQNKTREAHWRSSWVLLWDHECFYNWWRILIRQWRINVRHVNLENNAHPCRKLNHG